MAKDFFVSYTGADVGWAEWIAWILVEAGYTVHVQSWDFVPGNNWAAQMQEGTRAERTIVVLSEAYITGSEFGAAEWQSAFRDDPQGAKRKLIPIRIENCERPGLLAPLVGFDVFGVDEASAKKRVLNGIAAALSGSARPTSKPSFPGADAKPALSTTPVPFPGDGSPGSTVSASNPGSAGRYAELSRVEGAWTGAVAAVIDQKDIVRGTAFLVGADVALTCHHVVAAAAGPLRLRVIGSTTTEEVVEQDVADGIDLALLRVPAQHSRRWLRLNPAEVPIGSRIQSRGYPRDHSIARYPDGFPLDPTEVTGPITLNWNGRPVSLLVLAGATAVNGMSGAPAVEAQSGHVVGILRFSETDSQRALAIPAAHAVRHWPHLMTADGSAPTYADSVASVPEAMARSRQLRFTPESMHCVVITSEGQSSGEDSVDGLLEDVLSSSHAQRLWDAFRSAVDGRPLLGSDQPRVMAAEYTRKNVVVAAFSINDALSNHQSLELAVRLIVEADLAVFDVTGFEPGVMLLLGVRGATKRGVTINSHGGGWREGEPLQRPFNLSDLSLSSHTAVDIRAGEDPRLDRLAVRLETGFTQMARHPNYDDLPVFHSLRHLGPAEDASSSIPIDDEVLVLCSYDHALFANWNNLRRRLRHELSSNGINSTVARLQDLPTPQLVSQSLYERIRRCVACVADWTGASPSTFFELGVRLAVSPWNVVQIASRDWLSATTTQPAEGPGRIQVAQLQDLFSPTLYDGSTDTALGVVIAEQLLRLRRAGGLTGHRIRGVAGEALRHVQERVPSVVDQLTRDADALSQSEQRTNVPQALFYEITEIKKDHERAALDRRVAAWLFLEHVHHAGELPGTDERNQLWQRLGESVAAELFDSPHAAHRDLAREITGRIATI